MSDELSGSGSPMTQALIEWLGSSANYYCEQAREQREQGWDDDAELALVEAVRFRAAADALRSLPPLQADSEILRRGNIVEIAVANDTGSVSEYMNHWETRALKAEAEVAALNATLRGLPPTIAAGMIERLKARAERAEAEVARLTQARDTQLAANQEADFNCINCDDGLTKETWKWLGPNVGPFCDRCVTAAQGAAEGALGPLPPWQPIATAPKDDGVHVVLFASSWETPHVGWWCAEYGTSRPYRAEWCNFDGLFDDDPPTHWLPLPAGPLPSPQEAR